MISWANVFYIWLGIMIQNEFSAGKILLSPYKSKDCLSEQEFAFFPTLIFHNSIVVADAKTYQSKATGN